MMQDPNTLKEANDAKLKREEDQALREQKEEEDNKKRLVEELATQARLEYVANQSRGGKPKGNYRTTNMTARSPMRNPGGTTTGPRKSMREERKNISFTNKANPNRRSSMADPPSRDSKRSSRNGKAT